MKSFEKLNGNTSVKSGGSPQTKTLGAVISFPIEDVRSWERKYGSFEYLQKAIREKCMEVIKSEYQKYMRDWKKDMEAIAAKEEEQVEVK